MAVADEILARLEPFLEERDREWREQPDALRQPTLPSCVDGKVNVRALVKQLGMAQSREQWFFKVAELTSVVNAFATAQGLKPIGSRKAVDAADQVVERQMNRLQTERSDLSQTLAEREAVIERQRRYIAQLEAQLELRTSTGMILRTHEIV